MPTTTAVLAAMLTLLPPGKSDYSLIGNPPRRETYEEGLARYRTIADEIAELEAPLARYVLAVTYHESAWRRDVHSGLGRWARGDDGQSWCLGQLMLGRGSKRGRSLVGVDRAATRRCITAVAGALSGVIGRCARGRVTPTCVFAGYGGTLGASKAIRARVATYHRIKL